MTNYKNTTRLTGTTGENSAVTYLISNGYKIIERNLRISHGEIDIIANKDGTTVFVEVKSRAYSNINKYGRASDSVNYIKMKRFSDAVKAYIKLHPESSRCRIDVIEVYFNRGISEELAEIKHIKSAFGDVK